MGSVHILQQSRGEWASSGQQPDREVKVEMWLRQRAVENAGRTVQVHILRGDSGQAAERPGTLTDAADPESSGACLHPRRLTEPERGRSRPVVQARS